MKWLRSTNHLSYTFEGKVIPAYTEKPLQVSDDLYARMENNKVVASLVRNNSVIVLTKWQDDTMVNSDAERKLQAQQAQIEALQADLAKAKASDEVVQKAEKFDALKAEAEQALADKDAEIAALKAKLAEKQSGKSKKTQGED